MPRRQKKILKFFFAVVVVILMINNFDIIFEILDKHISTSDPQIRLLEFGINYTNFFVPEPKLSSTILAIVLTAEKHLLTRGIAVWETWGQGFDNIIFTCNCPNVIVVKNLIQENVEIPSHLKKFAKVSHLPILHINTTESSDLMGVKVLEVLKQSYAVYKHHSKWFYMVDDDAYVFVENFKNFVKKKNSSEPYMYGFKFKHLPLPGGHIGGGPGILLTNESMRLLVDKIIKNQCKSFIDKFGDVTIGGCGYAAGISIANTSDDKGKPLFHFHDPKTHFYGPVPPYLYEFGVHDKKIGKECCSLETIAFHYVKVNEMYTIHRNKTFLKDLLS